MLEAGRRWRSDCDTETVRGGERAIGVSRGVPLSLRLRAAVAVVKETFGHPFSNSLITVDPSRNTVSIVREPKS